ncbi:hypothetical protein ABW20_dc0105323 [Dactylellina cionopaga]|nr:hypothetical protein ABW20_dc0105323 [Dactylellina cionopaga]
MKFSATVFLLMAAAATTSFAAPILGSDAPGSDAPGLGGVVTGLTEPKKLEDLKNLLPPNGMPGMPKLPGDPTLPGAPTLPGVPAKPSTPAEPSPSPSPAPSPEPTP